MADEPPPQEFGSPADKLVLIVDDDPLIRDLLELALSGAGFKVLLAVDGLDAAKKLDAHEPHIILADLMMPAQGGFEFLRSLQGTPAGRLPVIVVTASSLDASTIAMIRQESNVVEFVNKPIRMNQLLAAVHKQLGTKPSSSAPVTRGLNDR